MWRQGQTHHPYTLIAGDVGTRGVFSRIYRCGDRDRHTTPIHSFLGTWGHGEYSLGYIHVRTGTDTPPLYTLISGDVGTRGVFSRIYRCGDRDRHTTPILSFLGTWGHGEYSLGYIHVRTGTDTPPLYTHFWGHGDTGSIL